MGATAPAALKTAFDFDVDGTWTLATSSGFGACSAGGSRFTSATPRPRRRSSTSPGRRRVDRRRRLHMQIEQAVCRRQRAGPRPRTARFDRLGSLDPRRRPRARVLDHQRHRVRLEGARASETACSPGRTRDAGRCCLTAIICCASGTTIPAATRDLGEQLGRAPVPHAPREQPTAPAGWRSSRATASRSCRSTSAPAHVGAASEHCLRPREPPRHRPGDPFFYVNELYGQIRVVTNDYCHTYAGVLNYNRPAVRRLGRERSHWPGRGSEQRRCLRHDAL